MFGRNFDSSNLLNLITSPNDPGMNSRLLTELDTPDEEIPECVDDPYDLKMLTNGLIQYLLLARMIRWLQFKTSRRIKKFKRKPMTSKLNAIGKQLT